MAKVCEISGKRPQVGNNRSHSMRATKRRFMPNLIVRRVVDPQTGRVRKMRIAASTLRTLNKSGRAK